MNYYKVLGLDKKASQSDIKTAYRKLAKQYHPDRNPNDPQAEEKFKEVSQAYAVLSNPQKKAQYDQMGDFQFRSQTQTDPNFRSSMFSDVDLSEIFQEMGLGDFDLWTAFGGGRGSSPFQRYQGGTGFEQQSHAQLDVELPLEITFEEAYQGSEKSLSLSWDKQKKLKVKIPAGVRPNQKLRVREGGRSSLTGRKGDLFLNISIKQHDVFKRKEDDLEMSATVPFSTLCLGGTLTVQTFEGPKTLKIKPGLSSGTKIRVKGLGFPKKSGRGDLYISVLPIIPKIEGQEELKQQILKLKELGL
jgi:curved DNA-binding protein